MVYIDIVYYFISIKFDFLYYLFVFLCYNYFLIFIFLKRNKMEFNLIVYVVRK